MLSWQLLLIWYFNCILCALCVGLENVSHHSAFSRRYTNVFYTRTEIFYFCIFLTVAKRLLMGELIYVYKSQMHGLNLLWIASVIRHLSWWFGAKKLKLTRLLFGLHGDLKCAEVCYKNMMHGLTWSNQDFAPFESEQVCELFGRMSIKSGQTTPTQSWLPDSDCWLLSFYIIEENLTIESTFFRFVLVTWHFLLFSFTFHT